jgi:hypothetical protein
LNRDYHVSEGRPLFSDRRAWLGQRDRIQQKNVFRNVMPCSVVKTYPTFHRNLLSPASRQIPWSWKQRVCHKRWLFSSRQHDVTKQKTVAAVKSSPTNTATSV